MQRILLVYMVDYYKEVFKRKSFHFFIGGEKTTEEDVVTVNNYIKSVVPLYSDIKTEIVIVKENETTCHRGSDYCILFYSEPRGDYLRNIGYIGEQIDLFLTSINIGTLWFGIGKPKEKRNNNLEYVIMMAIKKMPIDSFRKDMFKAKRKPLEEIWSGEQLNIANIVRFTPSACNTQPWLVEFKEDVLSIYRYKKPGKRGIMPIDKVVYYNRIDIGIFLFILETCLNKEGIIFQRELFIDSSNLEEEKTLSANYKIK